MWEKLCFFHISMTQHKHSLQSPFKTPFFHTLFDITLFVGAVVTGRLYWKKLKKFMKNLFNRGEIKKEDHNP
jgi:hypothetical protein